MRVDAHVLEVNHRALHHLLNDIEIREAVQKERLECVRNAKESLDTYKVMDRPLAVRS